MEEWRDMPGFEQYYSISDQGNVISKGRRYRNDKGRLIVTYPKKLKPKMNDKGAITYTLSLPDEHGKSKQYTVYAHRKVAEAFIPNVNNFSDVGHRDGIHHHNWKENLFWRSRKETVSNKAKSNEQYKVARRQNSKAIILYNSEKKLKFDSLKEAASFLGVSYSAVTFAKGKKTKCKGFFVIEDGERNKELKGNQIVLIDEQGNLTFYSSIVECANYLGRSAQAVSAAIRNDTRCNRYRVMRIK